MVVLISLLNSSPELTVEQFDWEFSVSDLIASIHLVSLNLKNKLFSYEVPSLLSEVLQIAGTGGKTQAYKLIWTLLEAAVSLDFLRGFESSEGSEF